MPGWCVAQWPAGTEQAVLTVTSRIATRDRAVDPGRDANIPALDPATARSIPRRPR